MPGGSGVFKLPVLAQDERPRERHVRLRDTGTKGPVGVGTAAEEATQTIR